jgi:hypothetical protein
LTTALVLKLPESPSAGQSALILNLGSDLSPARIDGNVTAFLTPALILVATKRPSVAVVAGNPAGCLVAEPDAHLRVPWVWAWRVWRIRVAAIALPPPTLELLSQSSDSSLVTRSSLSSLETLDDNVDGVGITTPSSATGASQSLPEASCLPYPYLLPIAESSRITHVVIVTAARGSDEHITECSEIGIHGSNSSSYSIAAADIKVALQEGFKSTAAALNIVGVHGWNSTQEES